MAGQSSVRNPGSARGRRIRWAALIVGGIAVLAAGAGGALAVLGGSAPPRSGDMQAFQLTGERKAPKDLVIQTGDGTRKTLGDYRGKVVLLNLWATWCGPCVREMPHLDRLQATLGQREDFVVLPLSLDNGEMKQVTEFYNKHDLQHLGRYLDVKTQAMKTLRPGSLPTTYLIERDGTIAGKLTGIAQWHKPAARKLIKHYL